MKVLERGAPASVELAAAHAGQLRWTGELADGPTEAAFRFYQLTRSRGVLSVMATLFAVVTVAFAVPDAAVMGTGPDWLAVLAMRVGVGLSILWLAAQVRRRPDWVAGRVGARAVTAVEAVTLGVFLVVCVLKPVGIANLNLSAIMLALCIVALVPGPFRHRAVATAAFYAAYVAVAVSVFPRADLRVVPFAGLFAAAYVVGIVFAVFVNRIERLAFAALEQERAITACLVDQMREAEVLRDELARQASEDELTGLLARRAFFARAAAMLRATDNAGGDTVAMVLDVDRFKSVNDRYGHAAGDDALRTLAAGLTAALRVYDIVGRLGGEEFAVLLPRADVATAGDVAERVRVALSSSPVAVDGGVVHLTVSIGLAGHAAGEPLEALLGRADAAMYVAKRAGGDRVQVAAPAPAIARAEQEAAPVSV